MNELWETNIQFWEEKMKTENILQFSEQIKVYNRNEYLFLETEFVNNRLKEHYEKFVNNRLKEHYEKFVYE